MKKYPQHMINIAATQKQKIALFTDEEIKAMLSEAENTLSGRGRLVVRPSGTEPLVRIMVECDDQDETVKITESLAEKIKKRLADY